MFYFQMHVTMEHVFFFKKNNVTWFRRRHCDWYSQTPCACAYVLQTDYATEWFSPVVFLSPCRGQSSRFCVVGDLSLSATIILSDPLRSRDGDPLLTCFHSPAQWHLVENLRQQANKSLKSTAFLCWTLSGTHPAVWHLGQMLHWFFLFFSVTVSYTFHSKQSIVDRSHPA